MAIHSIFSFSSLNTNRFSFSLLSPFSLLPYTHFHRLRCLPMDSATTTLTTNSLTTNRTATATTTSNKNKYKNNPCRKEKIVVILGATGTGKSRLSVDLAPRYSAEIINSDKIQVYRGLDITTNKISNQDRRGVPHHLLGEVNPENGDFTPADFRFTASQIISSLLSRKKLPIIAGGSNTFVHALLAQEYNPETDVFTGSGSVTADLKYNCCFLWVDVAFPVLCDYLRKRVDEMLDLGMFEELAGFYDPATTVKEKLSGNRVGLRKAIGVPEFDRYFEKHPPKGNKNNGAGFEVDRGERRKAYEEAVKEIKDNTCLLAKIQIGKIIMLRRAGWEMKRIDATEVFRAAMTSSDSGERRREIWEGQVMEPSVKIVNRFLKK